MTRLAIVSPCYNEEQVLEESAARMSRLFDQMVADGVIAADSFILYVNDGSKDRTWDIIRQLNASNRYVYGLCLAGNVGHQNAIMAGMMKVRDLCDAAITIDADLQDDISVIPQMVRLMADGNDVVYGVKVQRTADPLLKRLSAQAFYKLQSALGVKSVYNHADFRLMSRRALGYLAQYPERNLYLRGMIPLMGLQSATVDDVISPRSAGSSKYTLGKMLRLALDGVTSFSTQPITIIAVLGLFSLVVAFCMLVHIFYVWAIGNVVDGWTELMVSVWFLGSAILLAISTVGTYIGKIYAESKHRPLYLEGEYLSQPAAGA